MEREGREGMILISEVVIRRSMKKFMVMQNLFTTRVLSGTCAPGVISCMYHIYIYIYIPGCQLYFLGSFGRCGLSSVFSHKDFLHPFPEPTCHEIKWTYVLSVMLRCMHMALLSEHYRLTLSPGSLIFRKIRRSGSLGMSLLPYSGKRWWGF